MSRLGAASCGTRCTVHLHPVCLRRRICAEGDGCGMVQRMGSAPGLVGLALVRSSPTPNFRSHDGFTIAGGDESAMNRRQKVYSQKCVHSDMLWLHLGQFMLRSAVFTMSPVLYC